MQAWRRKRKQRRGKGILIEESQSPDRRRTGERRLWKQERTEVGEGKLPDRRTVTHNQCEVTQGRIQQSKDQQDKQSKDQQDMQGGSQLRAASQLSTNQDNQHAGKPKQETTITRDKTRVAVEYATHTAGKTRQGLKGDKRGAPAGAKGLWV